MTLSEIIIQKILPSLEDFTEENIIIDQKNHARKVKEKIALVPMYDPNQHYHHHYEMCFIAGNIGYLHTQGVNYKLGEGDFCVVPPSFKHCEMFLKNNKGYMIIWFIFTGSKIRLNLLLAKGLRDSFKMIDYTDAELPVYLLNILPFIYKTYQQRGNRWVNIVRGAFLSLFSFIADLPEQGKTKSDDTWHEKIMQEAIDFLKNNYNRELTLEEIARHMGFSPNYFSSLFKEYSGVSIFEYVNRIRVEKAKELLKDPKYRIKEISDILGYSSPYYFSSVFKKLTNSSPEKYRMKKR